MFEVDKSVSEANLEKKKKQDESQQTYEEWFLMM